MRGTRSRLSKNAGTSFVMAALATASLAGCAKHDGPTPDSTTSAMASSSNAPAASAMPTDITPVRGAIVSLSDSAVVVATANGDVRVILDGPVHVFQRANSDLGHVSAKSFVGVTSVKQADGSQLATEIHIFPEELRGTGQGSYLMTPQPGAHDSSRSTMTNGTVSAARAGEAPRMTNGAVASKSGEVLTVDYHSGTQTIKVPADVKVTAIEPATIKLTNGAKVVVLAKKQSDGTMKASSVLLASEQAK